MKILLILVAILAPCGAFAAESIKQQLVESLDAGSPSDSDLVHALAHEQAATDIGLVTDYTLTLLGVRRTDWMTRTVVCGFTGFIVTMAYESYTNKPAVPYWQHNLEGFLGGIAVPLGIQLELTSW